ncbi:ATP-binding domain-containing protein [Micromonospora sp. WMMD1155]|uniref:HelD family protein n=1 Tax=Micromonospora sp. WMMD1155 TaxID=3016094 RepID=UPI00249AF716|nr:ATP-binding domain-containing protein [Micromonospora sp. WMMD1155]WFE49494.1 AAA family ATPase [Micromonospora sp. WMMD1155]
MSRHSGGSGELPLDDEIGREQEYVSMLYDRLDGLREQAADRLTAELRNTGGTLQDRSQRDSSVAMYADQVEQFSAVENGLCFGRLDGDDDSRHYIGRIGIFDTSGDYDPLLMDWRAPAARPFYLATAANPQGVRRRRHLRTRQRKVTGLNDEVLDIDSASPGGHEELTGEASLLAALNAGRTGRMRDIVETIQAEQDEIIRAELPGVMVVQGGPGTGKTAVALHRAAYLLYTHRRELSSRGVLLVGPNATFLRYISQVLPTLAETGVLLRTQGDLFPGVNAQRVEPAETAALKGRAVLAEVLVLAVRDRQWVPDEPLEIEVERETLTLDPETVRAARDRVRRTERPHNLARALFDVEIVHALAEQVAERIGADPLGGDNLLDEADRAEIRRELREESEIQSALDRLWPVLTPQRLLADLFADPDRIATAAPMLTDDERALLRREPGGWTPADVPLLDEAAELLGEDERAAAARRDRIRMMEREYAEGVLEIARGSRSIDVEDEAEGGEILGVTDLIDADRLLERQEEADRLTTAQRAAADRTWAFGHVIVDEAQELSPMAWRLLMRRCPSRSMTIVGDVAQTGALSGTPSWADALAPYVAQRWRLTELTVSYRTPAEIMAVAADVLAEIDPALRPPRSVRASGVPPWDRTVPDEQLAAELVAEATREAAGLTDGRLGVLVPAGRVGELGSAVTAALPEAAVGEHPELESRVVVLTVAQAKGLEFDSVLVVDPDRMVAESPRGRSDLYVALTRATQRLGILRPAESRT